MIEKGEKKHQGNKKKLRNPELSNEIQVDFIFFAPIVPQHDVVGCVYN